MTLKGHTNHYNVKLMKGYGVHATNKRLFISTFDGKAVQDFVYDHISSLLFTAKHYHWLIVLGAILLASLFYMNSGSRMSFQMGFDSYWIGLLAGVAIILLGIFLKKSVMMIFVIGVPKPPTLQGDRKNLEDLFRTIRERKGVSAASPIIDEES